MNAKVDALLSNRSPKTKIAELRAAIKSMRAAAKRFQVQDRHGYIRIGSSDWQHQIEATAAGLSARVVAVLAHACAEFLDAELLLQKRSLIRKKK